jgi:hypothetical protein
MASPVLPPVANRQHHARCTGAPVLSPAFSLGAIQGKQAIPGHTLLKLPLQPASTVTKWVVWWYLLPQSLVKTLCWNPRIVSKPLRVYVSGCGGPWLLWGLEWDVHPACLCIDIILKIRAFREIIKNNNCNIQLSLDSSWNFLLVPFMGNWHLPKMRKFAWSVFALWWLMIFQEANRKSFSDSFQIISSRLFV